MSGQFITFACPDCKRENPEVARIDTDPPNAVRVVLQCNYCDDGDRHSPEFFDSDGKWVHPLNHQDPRP